MKKIFLVLILSLSFAVKSDEVVSAIDKSDNIAFFADSVSIAFPKSIADFVFVGSIDYNVQGLGFSLRYKVDSINLDLYIYDKRLKDIPNGLSKYTQNELRSVFKEIEILGDRNIYSDIKRISDHNGRFKRMDFEYNRAVLNLNALSSQQPGKKQTEVILFGFRHNFFKIRVTYPLENSEEYFEKVTGFIIGLDDILYNSLSIE